MTRAYFRSGSSAALARRSKMVSQLRSGLTLEQIAATHGISRQRVSQILGASVYEWKARPPGRRAPIDRVTRTVRRFWARVRVDANGCWMWTGYIDPAGYGRASRPGVRGVRRSDYAHRLSWEAHHGPIPAGLTIDHLCRNRACCNPEHLEPVTLRENILRSPIAPAAVNARKTHCPHGHEYTPENTDHRKGSGRRCRTCRLAGERARRAAA